MPRVSNACSGEPGEVPDNEVNAHLGNPGLGGGEGTRRLTVKRYLSVLTVIALALAAGYGTRTNATGSTQDAVEAEIKRLEQVEVQAVLAKDTATLEKLWDKKLVVNAPFNRVVVANSDPVDRPVLKMPRTSFTREVEHIAVRGDVVISMGSETVVPGGDLPKSGRTVKRRYTNIWMRVDGAWKLIARHANEICEQQ
jgi:Domain of unknown function (DUF4440)